MLPDQKRLGAKLATARADDDARIGRIFALSVAVLYGLMLLLYGLGL